MNTASALAPLASPHGAGRPDELAPEMARELAPRLSVRLSLESAFRHAYIELLSPGALLALVGAEWLFFKALSDMHPHGLGPWTALWNIGVVGTAAFVALVTALSTLSRFVLGRRYDLELSSKGICKRSAFSRKGRLFRWRHFLWVLELDGDLWLATSGQGCFVPRECFESRAPGPPVRRARAPTAPQQRRRLVAPFW